MKKQKLLSIIIVSALMLSALPTNAADFIDVYMNGEKINFDVEPMVINGRTMVPMRAIFEKLGAAVDWKKETSTAVATRDTIYVSIAVGSDVMETSSGEIQLDAPAMIVDSRTLLPLRAVSEAFMCKVEWDGNTKTVRIYSDDFVSNGNETSTIIMYAPDGRTAEVEVSKIDEYKNVGWYIEPVQTLYALDGRTLDVVESEVEAYKNVGWYDFEDYVYERAERDIIEYDYANAVANLEKYTKSWNNEYVGDEELRKNITNKINEVICRWYSSTGIPLVATGWNRTENSIGTPEINIVYRNISPKAIVAFESEFTCYDAYGDVANDYPSIYDGTILGNADNTYILPGQEEMYTMTLYSYDKTHSISWPKVVRLAFEDGTTWHK